MNVIPSIKRMIKRTYKKIFLFNFLVVNESLSAKVSFIL